mmetsp:Transcript_489/g.709  ORF Transcript_489/g.709 Transcript_489/m.709 type:complete len:387 (-) Transcript_489:230-1390(-)
MEIADRALLKGGKKKGKSKLRKEFLTPPICPNISVARTDRAKTAPTMEDNSVVCSPSGGKRKSASSFMLSSPSKRHVLCLKNFKCIGELSRTIFGRAYLAERTSDKTRVVIKMSSTSKIEEEAKRGCKEDPLNEISVLRDLHSASHGHPGRQFIVGFHGSFSSNRRTFLVLEWCNSKELLQHLMTQRGRLKANVSRRFSRQLALALCCVHSIGYAHLDVSLENIMLHTPGNCHERLEVRLIDFGRAQPCNSPFHFKGESHGKKIYMSPERFAERKFDGQSSDVWSFGMCVLAMTSGHMGLGPNDTPESGCRRFDLLMGGPRLLKTEWSIGADEAELLGSIFRKQEQRCTIGTALRSKYLRVVPETGSRKQESALSKRVRKKLAFNL